MSESAQTPNDEQQSSLNIDPKLAGALCYLFGCLSGILLFLLETQNKQIRFHALQSILLFTVLSLMSVFATILSVLTNFVPFQIASSLIWVLHFVLWLVLIIKTFQGVTIQIPVLADFAREQVGWPERNSGDPS